MIRRFIYCYFLVHFFSCRFSSVSKACALDLVEKNVSYNTRLLQHVNQTGRLQEEVICDLDEASVGELIVEATRQNIAPGNISILLYNSTLPIGREIITIHEGYNQTQRYENSCIDKSLCYFVLEQSLESDEEVPDNSIRMYISYNGQVLFNSSLDDGMKRWTSPLFGEGCHQLCQNEEELVLFRLELMTDQYPAEVSWELRDENGAVLMSRAAGFYENSLTKYFEYLPLCDGECFKFEITDTLNDGICCGYGEGHYNIFVNGSLIGEGGEYEASEVAMFGKGCPWPSSSPSSSPSGSPSPSLSMSPTRPWPSSSPSLSVSPTQSPTNCELREGDFGKLSIELHLHEKSFLGTEKLSVWLEDEISGTKMEVLATDLADSPSVYIDNCFNRRSCYRVQIKSGTRSFEASLVEITFDGMSISVTNNYSEYFGEDCGGFQFMDVVNGLRRFPAIPEISVGTSCNDTTKDDARVGCISLPRSQILKAPEWSGKLHFKPPSCQQQPSGRKICQDGNPQPKNLGIKSHLHLVAEAINMEDVLSYFYSSYALIHGDYDSYYDITYGIYDTSSIVVGDIDGDGDLDIVIGNYEGANILLINRGDGSFLDNPMDLPGGYLNTTSIALGDIDGDGHLDIVIGNNGDPNQVLLNSGDGTFQDLPMDLPGGNQNTSSIAVGDIDGDGNLDIIIGNLAQANQILMNSRDGRFLIEPCNLPGVFQDTTSIAIGDVDGDGDLDIVIGNTKGRNQLLINHGDGSFLYRPVDISSSNNTSFVALGDMDSDGDLDIVIANAFEANEILINNGDGTFSSISVDLPYFDQHIITSIALGDIDGDGDLDIVIGISDGFFGLIINDGDTTYYAILLPVWGQLTSSFALGDIDGDGDLDITFGNSKGSINLSKNGGGIRYLGPTNLPNPRSDDFVFQHSIVLGDIDGDGDLDIVTGNDGWANQVLFNGGKGSFITTTDLPGGDGRTTSVALGDIDGDGDLDIVTGNDGWANQVLLNQGDGSFMTPLDLPGGDARTTSIALGDIDCDGDLDIVTGNDGWANQVLFNQGDGSFRTTVDLPGGNQSTTSIALGDIDGNGYLDVVIGNRGGTNQVLFNSGDGHFMTTVDLPGSNKYTFFMALGDIDSDGDLDIVIGNSFGANQVLYNSGDGHFMTTMDLPGSDKDTFSMALGDIDGDGYLDIVIGNSYWSNEVLYNDGNGTFMPWSTDLPNSHDITTTSIALGDINGDGYIDVAIGNQLYPNQVLFSSVCPYGGARLHSKSWCFHCPIFMELSSNSEYCKECLPDHIRNPGTDVCSDFPCPFEKRSLGQDECTTCEDGTFYFKDIDRTDITTWHIDRCVLCPYGTYANNTILQAVDSCFSCQPGSYQNGKGSSECITCAEGEFQTQVGSTSCEICETGGYCTGSKSFRGGYVPCPDGTFNDQLGMSSPDACQPCTSGTFSKAVEGIKGATKCTECPYPLSSFNTSSNCDVCKEGFYMNSPNVSVDTLYTKPTQYCLECPDGANCPIDSHLSNLTVLPGYWRDSKHTATLYKCHGERISKACNHTDGGTLEGYCAMGHTGPLCQVCTNDYFFFDLVNGECNHCPSLDMYLLRILIILIVILGVYAITWWSKTNYLTSLGVVLHSANIQTKVKVLVGFYQVIASFSTVYGVEVHSDVHGWFNITQFFSLEVFKILAFPKKCLENTIVSYVVSTTWPFAIIVVSLGIFAVKLLWERKVDTQKSVPNKLRIDMNLIHVTILVLYFTLPTVSTSIFDAKKCRAFDTNDSFNVHPKDRISSYLLANLAIACKMTDPVYARIQILFWVFFSIWLCAVPLFYFFLILRINKSVYNGRPDSLALSCRFLWEDFDENSPVAIFWDVIDSMRKIFLTGFINFIDEQDGSTKILRLSMAATISSFFGVLLAYAHPYKRHDDFILAMISYATLVLCFVLGIILKLCNDANDNCKVLVSSGLDYKTASILVTFLALALLVITIGIFLFLAYQSPIIRLHQTGYPPNMEMSSDCENHIFVSHIWKSGQDKVHAIVRTLTLYLPSLRIWLDVDKMTNMDELETGVRGSEVFLLFYSQGYFVSKNCQSEFFHAIQYTKPILVLYDGEDKVLDDMREEFVNNCEVECLRRGITLRDALGRLFMEEPIQWMKTSPFTAESLKLIYLSCLRHLPRYIDEVGRGDLAHGLHIPGELKRPKLSKPIKMIFFGHHEDGDDIILNLQHMQIIRKIKSNQWCSFFSRLFLHSKNISHGMISVKRQEDYLYKHPYGREKEEIFLDNNNDDEVANFTFLNPTPNLQKEVMLLYLNQNTFARPESAFVDSIKAGITNGIPMILLHEHDIYKGGCDFDFFFQQVPQELIDPPYSIFKDIAIPLYHCKDYRKVGLEMLVHKLETI